MALTMVTAKPGALWRMKITDGTRFEGRHLSPGEIVDVPVSEAVMLLASGRAVRHVEPPAAPPIVPAITQHAEEPSASSVVPDPETPPRAARAKKTARS